VASVTVSGPSFRLPPDRLLHLADLVRNTAARISAQLGHRPAGTAMLTAARRAALHAEPAPATTSRTVPTGAATTSTGVPTNKTTAQGAGGDPGTAAGRRNGTDKAASRRPQMGVAGPVFGD
jgi:hypothetical protein